jgi:hypothetical protein
MIGIVNKPQILIRPNVRKFDKSMQGHELANENLIDK